MTSFVTISFFVFVSGLLTQITGPNKIYFVSGNEVSQQSSYDDYFDIDSDFDDTYDVPSPVKHQGSGIQSFPVQTMPTEQSQGKKEKPFGPEFVSRKVLGLKVPVTLEQKKAEQTTVVGPRFKEDYSDANPRSSMKHTFSTFGKPDVQTAETEPIYENLKDVRSPKDSRSPKSVTFSDNVQTIEPEEHIYDFPKFDMHQEKPVGRFSKISGKINGAAHKTKKELNKFGKSIKNGVSDAAHVSKDKIVGAAHKTKKETVKFGSTIKNGVSNAAHVSKDKIVGAAHKTKKETAKIGSNLRINTNKTRLAMSKFIAPKTQLNFGKSEVTHL